MDSSKLALELHKKHAGKITIALRDTLDSKEKLSAYYSPGVAAVSQLIAERPELLREYTWVNNLVAIVSDGTAVLGLGNIGPAAALPVMEGKALLFKHFANIDAVPIVLNTSSVDEAVATIKAIAPSFGGINLEDFAAPQCFEIEERLKAELDIPVFHDDQHGTAVIVLAGLINAMKVVSKNLSKTKVVLIGAGAAGIATAKLLHLYAKPKIVAVDSKGIVHAARSDLTTEKRYLASLASPDQRPGTVRDALEGADIVIGVSRGNMLHSKDIAIMNERPVIFALANPTPEIMPEEAKKAGVAVIATGRSDYPNQVNNALAFPGIFRGALDNRVAKITDKHKIAAAEVIASLVAHPTVEQVIPSIFDARLVSSIAKIIV